jgi:hypothetical protein
MRASPAFQVSIVRFGVWRAAVAAIAALSAGAIVAWWAGDDASRSTAIVWPLALLSVAAIGGGASLLRCAPQRLRWDTQRWLLGGLVAQTDELAPGRLSVAFDLGVWMLLKFEHDLTNGRRRVRWLPVQRLGLEHQWHALRCAVYFARSVPGHDAGPNSASSPESQE